MNPAAAPVASASPGASLHRFDAYRSKSDSTIAVLTRTDGDEHDAWSPASLTTET